MSSSSVSQRLISVSIFAVVAMQLSFIDSVLSLNLTNAYLQHLCINREGTYKSEAYENEIQNLLDSISTTLDSGYGNGASGSFNTTDNDLAALVQCRGDTSLSECRSCVGTAFSAIRKKCPKNRGRIIWYDYCLLDLSRISNYGKLDYKHNVYLYNAKDVSGDTKSFNKNTKALLYKLKEKATRKEQTRYTKTYMYATGEENLGTMKLNGMVQCTQDLTLKNCSMCLDSIIAKLPRCCNGKQGGRVLNRKCYVRYELYPFVKT